MFLHIYHALSFATGASSGRGVSHVPKRGTLGFFALLRLYIFLLQYFSQHFHFVLVAIPDLLSRHNWIQFANKYNKVIRITRHTQRSVSTR